MISQSVCSHAYDQPLPHKRRLQSAHSSIIDNKHALVALEAQSRLKDYKQSLLEIRMRKHRERVSKTRFLSKMVGMK